MHKKITIFISSLFVLLKISIAVSDESNLLPIKKPKLTDQELKEKILINILKPLPKPIENIKTETKKKNTEKMYVFLVEKWFPIFLDIIFEIGQPVFQKKDWHFFLKLFHFLFIFFENCFLKMFRTSKINHKLFRQTFIVNLFSTKTIKK